ncbi:MAG: hypothetical protein OSB57_11580 [Planctomycetota bacterium]|nr:hypothetical protein [Planctomycetota bacterium]
MISLSCQSSVKNRNPLGEYLPAVSGEALTGEHLTLPLQVPSVLLVGFVQEAQFDADRWLVGLLDNPKDIRILEVPTVRGFIPGLISGTIDSGMRSGIPQEDWPSVVTLYGEDASTVVDFTGNERPRNMRVLLLDQNGRVCWFHDRGFSATHLIDLKRAVDQVNDQ